MKRMIEEVPVWALCYMMYGDAEGLTDREKNMVDNFLESFVVVSCTPITDNEGELHPFFSDEPLFGLPCEVVDCEIIHNEKEY